MFIIKSGIVEVLDFQGEEEVVYATLTQGLLLSVGRLLMVVLTMCLGTGQYFGELALLSLAHVGSRRTAYVRSVGYTEVFVMHKKEMQTILESDDTLRNNIITRASKLLGDMSPEAKEHKAAFARVANELRSKVHQ